MNFTKMGQFKIKKIRKDKLVYFFFQLNYYIGFVASFFTVGESVSLRSPDIRNVTPNSINH